MAYLVEDKDQEQQAQQNASPPGANPNNQDILSSGGGVISPTGSASGAQPIGPASNNPAPTSSGSFTNLQKYLDQNQDQGKPIADKVTGVVQQQASDARGFAQNAANQFQSEVNQQIPQLDQGLLQNITPSGPAGQHTQPTQNPDFIAANNLTDDQKAAIKAARTGVYQGPNTIEDTGLLADATQKANEAKQSADLSATEPGRFTLLQKAIGTPNYTHGQQRLDQALLETNPEAESSLENLRSSIGNLPQDIQSYTDQANAYVAPVKQKIADQNTQVSSSLQAAIDNEMGQLNQNAANANVRSASDYQRLLNLLNSNDPNQKAQAYQALTGQSAPNAAKANPLTGLIDKPNFDPTFYRGLDPNSYITHPLDQATSSSIANQSDLSELQSLADLAGQQTQYIDPTQVGQYNSQVSLDPQKYLAAVEKSLGDYRSTNPLEQIDLSGLLGQTGASLQSGNYGQNNLIGGIGAYNNFGGATEGYNPQVAQENKFLTELGLKPLDSSTAANPLNYQGSDATERPVYQGIYNALQQYGMTDDQIGSFFKSANPNQAPEPYVLPPVVDIPKSSNDPTSETPHASFPDSSAPSNNTVTTLPVAPTMDQTLPLGVQKSGDPVSEIPHPLFPNLTPDPNTGAIPGLDLSVYNRKRLYS